MLGHVLWRECSARFDASATVRDASLDGPFAGALDPDRTLTGVTVEDLGSVERALAHSDATVAVNCIGLVKQRPEATDAAEEIRINALFPHQLATACAAQGVRLIHISTDCVFSGQQGDYGEADPPDPVDLYGRSKLLGEPQGPGVLTLRTSMIGPELGRAQGLLEWLLSQVGEVRGFTRARFSGPTTPVLARLVADLIERHPELDGTWHVAAEPISKHDLLVRLRDAFGLDLEVVPDPGVAVDRSLDASRLRAATGWVAPSWTEMVTELAEATSARAKGRHRVAH